MMEYIIIVLTGQRQNKSDMKMNIRAFEKLTVVLEKGREGQCDLLPG